MSQYIKTVTRLRLLPDEIKFCWILHEGKSCREISEATHRSLKYCSATKSSILRKLGLKKLEQFRGLTKEELNTLIYSATKTTQPRDYEAYSQAVKIKKEKQLQAWENNVSPEHKEILRAWFTRKSAHLLKKNSDIHTKDVQQIIREVNQLIEASKSPLGYSLKDLCKMDE
jgi:hypothetical protein